MNHGLGAQRPPWRKPEQMYPTSTFLSSLGGPSSKWCVGCSMDTSAIFIYININIYENERQRKAAA